LGPVRHTDLDKGMWKEKKKIMKIAAKGRGGARMWGNKGEKGFWLGGWDEEEKKAARPSPGGKEAN